MLISHFRVKILLNFAHASEARKANFHENNRIIYRLPFMKKVYCLFQYKRVSGSHFLQRTSSHKRDPEEEGVTPIARHQRASNKTKARSQTRGKVE